MTLRSIAATMAVGVILAGAALPAFASDSDSDDTNVTVAGGGSCSP
jgi:uncharacterized protein YggE